MELKTAADVLCFDRYVFGLSHRALLDGSSLTHLKVEHVDGSLSALKKRSTPRLTGASPQQKPVNGRRRARGLLSEFYFLLLYVELSVYNILIRII